MLPVLTYYGQSKQPLTVMCHMAQKPDSTVLKCMALESVPTDSVEGEIETVDSR